MGWVRKSGSSFLERRWKDCDNKKNTIEGGKKEDQCLWQRKEISKASCLSGTSRGKEIEGREVSGQDEEDREKRFFAEEKSFEGKREGESFLEREARGGLFQYQEKTRRRRGWGEGAAIGNFRGKSV